MNAFEKEYYEDVSFWEGDMLHDEANMQRFHTTSNLIKKDVKSLLDVGCGNGVFINLLAKARSDLKIVGVDRSQTALSFVETPKVLGDITDLPFDDNSFDCVSCLEVIEHLPVNAFEKALSELSRVSNKYLIISVPYKETLEDSYNQCPSCKTIFNYELHLRSFDDDYFKDIVNKFGFKNIISLKEGLSIHFKYHNVYRKIFYPEQYKSWKSPICPVCGYSEDVTKVQQGVLSKEKNDKPHKRKLVSYFSRIPKMIWPKETKHYWIIGLFEKIKIE